MADLRESQSVIEALDQGDPALRESQSVLETLDQGTPALRVSQSVVEVLVAGPSYSLLVSQCVMEVLEAIAPPGGSYLFPPLTVAA